MVGVLGLCGSSIFADNREVARVSVIDTIEVRRLHSGPIISPDGSRFVVLLYRGDLARNANRMDVFAGSATSLDAAQRGRIVASFFSEEHAADTFFFSGRTKWLDDNERVVLALNGKNAPHRIVALNIRTGETETLVSSRGRITSFSASKDATTVVYSARADEEKSIEVFEQMIERGFTLSADQSVMSLYRGIAASEHDPNVNDELLVAALESGRRVDRALQIPRHLASRALDPWISPDGRWAVIAGSIANETVPEAWLRYTHRVLRHRIVSQRQVQGRPDVIGQLWLANLQTGEVRPLWDAPLAFSSVAWSPDSTRVIVAPAFPPVTVAHETGLEGGAVAEVNLDGTVHLLPLSTKAFILPAVVTWDDAVTVRLENADGSGGQTRWNGVAWERILDESGPPTARTTKSRITFAVDQDLNRSPVLVAVDQRMQERREILDIDPQQQQLRLGRVELVEWVDEARRTWRGRLYLPVDYRKGERYPLVVACDPGDRTVAEFSLRGYEWGGTPLSIGQPLAGRGIAMLAGFHQTDGRILEHSTATEYQGVQTAVEGAIVELDRRGLIDPSRVGLVGFSRTGAYALYTAANSDHPFAASLVSDNVKYTYEQYISLPLIAPEADDLYASRPFGAGLKNWLERAPNFQIEHIYGPVLLEAMTSFGAIASQWEIYALLRHLQKPVELYAIPELEERGSHGVILPKQQYASLEQAVDWFDFWLNGREQDDVAKVDQYERWRKLRELHEGDKKKPRPPRLEWEAKEVPRKPVIEGM